MPPKRMVQAAWIVVACILLAGALLLLAGCSLEISRDRIACELGFPHANHEHAIRITQPNHPTTQPAEPHP